MNILHVMYLYNELKATDMDFIQEHLFLATAADIECKTYHCLLTVLWTQTMMKAHMENYVVFINIIVAKCRMDFAAADE